MKYPALLLAACCLLAGCRGGFSERSAEQRSGVFRYALAASPITYDPGRVQDVEGIELLSNVYEGLVAYDENNRVTPRLAASVEPSEQGKVWTFSLRKDAKFHNGRPVVAADVKWTWERNLRKAFSSPTALNYLSDIVGAEELNEGKAEELAGVEVLDDHTLRVTLVEARPYFLGKLTYPCAFILAKEAAGDKGIVDLKSSVGTGPFKLALMAQDQQVTLEANRDYYDGAPVVEKIERPIIKDAVTRLNKFRSGELDILTIQRAEIGSVQSDAQLASQLRHVPRPGVFYIGVNRNLYKPFQDLRVRRAFAMGIDRTRICRDLLNGMPEAKGLIAHGIVGYREDYKGLPYDPDQARRLLSAAGYPGGKGLPPLELLYVEQAPDSRILVEGVHSSLKQIGFPVRLQALERSIFFERRNNGRLPGWHLSWFADYLDPQNFLSFLLLSDSPMNHEKYANPEFDRVAREADRTLDEARRIELYQQAEDLLIQDVARVPIYFGRDSQLVSPRVKGLRQNLLGMLPHTKVQVER